MLFERQALDLLNRIPLLRRLGPSFLRYLLVGGLGFLVDAGLLELFIFLDLSVYAARGLVTNATNVPVPSGRMTMAQLPRPPSNVPK